MPCASTSCYLCLPCSQATSDSITSFGPLSANTHTAAEATIERLAERVRVCAVLSAPFATENRKTLPCPSSPMECHRLRNIEKRHVCASHHLLLLICYSCFISIVARFAAMSIPFLHVGSRDQAERGFWRRPEPDDGFQPQVQRLCQLAIGAILAADTFLPSSDSWQMRRACIWWSPQHESGQAVPPKVGTHICSERFMGVFA